MHLVMFICVCAIVCTNKLPFTYLLIKYLREKDTNCLFIHLYGTGSIIPHVSIYMVVPLGFQRLLQNIAVRK